MNSFRDNPIMRNTTDDSPITQTHYNSVFKTTPLTNQSLKGTHTQSKQNHDCFCIHAIFVVIQKEFSDLHLPKQGFVFERNNMPIVGNVPPFMDPRLHQIRLARKLFIRQDRTEIMATRTRSRNRKRWRKRGIYVVV